MKNRITSAGTNVDSEQKSEVTMSCPNNGNTIVVRCFSGTRYIIIADAPRLSYNIGRILTPIKDGSNYYDCIDAPSSEIIGYPEKYPAVFRKLDWWEYRKGDELPKYVIELTIKGANKVWKVLEYVTDYEIRIPTHFYEPYIITDDVYKWQIPLRMCLPSTEGEYLSHLAQLECVTK